MPPLHPSTPNTALSFLSRLLIILLCWLPPPSFADNHLVPVTLQLKWKHAFQFAGYYAALEKGFYSNAGLEVRILEHQGDYSPIEALLEGRAEYAVTAADILIHRTQGKPVVALASIFQHSPYAFLVKAESGINSVTGFVGQRVMLGSGIQDAALRATLRRAGLSLDDLTILPTSFDVRSLIRGDTDVFNAYVTDQGFALQETGIEGRYLLPKQYGIDFYGDVLATTEAEAEQHPQRLRNFLKASLRGWEYALNHPDELIDLILAKYNTQELSRKHLEYEARTSRELIQPLLVRIGHMNPARWEHIRDVFTELELIPPGSRIAGLIYAEDDQASSWARWLVEYWNLLLAGLVLFLVAVLLLFNLQMRRLIRQRTAELAQSEHSLRTLIDMEPACVKTLDRKGRLLTMNRAGLAMIDADRIEQVCGHPITELVDKPYRKQFIELIKQVFTGHSGSLLFRATGLKGHKLWLETHAVPFREANGEISRLLSVTQDVTQRIKAENTALQQQRSNQSMLANIPGAIYRCMYDHSRSMLFISDYIEQLTEYPADDFINNAAISFLELIHPADIEPSLDYLDKRLWDHDDYYLEFRIIRQHDRAIRWLADRGTASRGQDGKILCLDGALFDITERKQTDDALHILVESMVGLTGQAFFDKTVSALCRWFNADGASIGVIEDDEWVQAIALTLDGELISDYGYPLAGSPCREVADTTTCLYPQDVAQQFPEDPELEKLGVQGYAGTPIRDQHHKVIGIVWVISRQPLNVPTHWEDALNIIAAKAGAEILRRRTERSLKENMERYRALVESTQDFVWETDSQSRYTYCSPQTKTILGYKPEELIGKTPFDFMPPEVADQVSSQFTAIIQQRRPFSSLENLNLHKQGHQVILDTSGMPFFDANGELAGYRGIDRDITQRKQAESYLRESERRFRELIESLPNVAVQGYDRELRVIYWNAASSRLYGYTEEEALGAQLQDLIIPESMYDCLVEAHHAWLERGQPIPPGELELLHKDGHLLPVFSSHVLLNQDTDNPEMFCIDVDQSEQKRALDKLEHLATYDQLTHLPNRYLLESELSNRIKEAERFGQKLAILFIDLDNFKVINDSMGHEYGDILLLQVAKRLSSQLRKYDTVARFGGDEFVLMMPMIQENSEVAAVAKKIIREFATVFDLKEQEAFVTTSIGISLFPDDGQTTGELLQNADAAMYRAKDAGRNRYQFFTQTMNDELRRYQQIETQLRRALETEVLQLYYQPQVDLRSGKIKSCEALLRWLPEDGEPISPAEFIPVAERSELIIRIGECVINAACRQRAAWKARGLRDFQIDINISGRQFLFHDLYQVITKTLQRYGLSPTDIGIELTENVLIKADEKILSDLKRLHQAGMQIAIDDFGTGYSSLSYLKRFPVDNLKIDRAFVRDAPHDSDDRSIMEAIVAVGHRLGMKVVVEGVENQAQHALSIEIGCDLAQGYYFHRPMPAEQLEALLEFPVPAHKSH
jgi:diguanylate cyclase (GGDEF)-like protein/PAS domain S-box-containing protein